MSARRFTSANRTCSMTCWLSEPPGSCSMLMILNFPELAAASSPARSMIALLETLPDRMSASSFTETRMSSPGKRAASCCCRMGTPASTTTSYCFRAPPGPHRIRLIVPAALPSMSTSRGATAVASATAGFVTASRVMSNDEVSTIERPALNVSFSKASGADPVVVAGGCAAGGA